MKEMYDNPRHVEDTFTEDNLSEYLLQAQWAEFVELKKIIKELYDKKKTHLRILDIGIGNARILKHFVGIDEIWSKIKYYEGIDIAKSCINISDDVISSLNIKDKASVQLLDAINLNKLNKRYDLIISTWFTVGNFYPSNFSFEDFKPGFDMSTNDKFTSILSQAYNLLDKDGELVIGSMYIDTPETRIKQEDSYKHFGWTVITDQRDCFTATKDGWWSQRYTKKRVFDYLPTIPKKNFSFIPLDTYEYAMMVKIIKN